MSLTWSSKYTNFILQIPRTLPSKCHKLHRNVTNSIIQMSLSRSSKLIIKSTHHGFRMRNESHSCKSSTNSIIHELHHSDVIDSIIKTNWCSKSIGIRISHGFSHTSHGLSTRYVTSHVKFCHDLYHPRTLSDDEWMLSTLLLTYHGLHNSNITNSGSREEWMLPALSIKTHTPTLLFHQSNVIRVTNSLPSRYHELHQPNVTNSTIHISCHHSNITNSIIYMSRTLYHPDVTP